LSKKYQKQFLQSLFYEELEPRLLFSADLEGALINDSLPEENFLDYSAIEADINPVAAPYAAIADQSENQRHELVIIDSATPDYQQLLDDLLSQAENNRHLDVVMLDANSDGVSQITEILSDRSDLDAVHLISHAADGEISLGSSILDLETLLNNSTEIQGWGEAFTEEGDILIYGCNLAATENGQILTSSLAQLTGTDVAASDDLTGQALLGGDWLLEYKTGNIETSIALDQTTRADYEGILDAYVVSNTNATGTGSLYEAILDANANVGVTDTITFNIVGGGPHVINLTGALPVISDALIIDGSTEPDFSFAADGSPRPVIVIDGSGAGAVNGLVIGASGGGSTVRGLVIQNFQNDGILVQGANNTIAGNIFGLQADGVTVAGNNLVGTGMHGNIRIESANNVIGGLTEADRNIISGGGFDGIALIGAGATDNQVIGNYIGTDISGTLARGNAQEGIEIDAANDNIIGGTVAGARNIVSGNGSDGIEIDSADNTIIQGNYIGTDYTGTLALGNVRDGIDLNENVGDGATGTLIGGTNPNAGNLISGNGIHGVEVRDAPTTGNSILGNQIYNNGQLGIQLSTDGIVTLNDSNDGDTGANNLQNFPVIASAFLTGTDLSLSGSLDTDGLNTQYRIEFFGMTVGTQDATNGESPFYLGTTTLTTNGSGDGIFSNVILSGVTLSPGDFVTATVTKITDPAQVGINDILAYGSTSELAVNVAIVLNNAPVATNDPSDFSSELLALNPLSYWRLGETNGAAVDIGSSGIAGTYNGGTLGQTGAINGDNDTAVWFDGLDDYVALAHSNDYELTDGTVQLWFNADTPANGDLQHLFSKDSQGNDGGGHLSIYLNASGNLEVRLQSALADYYVMSPSAVNAGVWHHVAFSFGTDGMTLYLDGEIVATDSYTGGLLGNLEPIAIGAGTQNSGDTTILPINQFFTGLIDEVAIVDNQLNTETIQDLYASGLQHYTINEDGTLNVLVTAGVLANDFDVDGDALTVSLVSDVSNGTLVLNADGSFNYTPTAEWNGTDSFTYKTNDGSVDSNIATVTITVNPINDTPTTTEIADVTVDEDAVNSVINLFTAFADIEDTDAALTYTIESNSNAGLFTATTIDGVAGTLTLDYAPDQNGTADITIRATDTGGEWVESSFTVTITSLNDAPFAQDDRINLSFDGIDDYVLISDDPSLVMTNNLTIEAWINPTGAGTGSQLIVNKEGEYELGITADTGEIIWAFDNVDPDWSWHNTGYFATANEWTHITVTYESGIVKTYANGVLVDTYNGSGSIGDTYTGYNELRIGGRQNAGNQRFDGMIDEVRLWNNTRTVGEISANMATGLIGNEAGLVGNWRFDEGSGTTVFDRSSSGNDGTLGGIDGVAAEPTWKGYVTDENTILNIPVVSGVLANDVDVDNDPLTATNLNTTGTLGLVTLNNDGSFTYNTNGQFESLAAGDHATDTFTYTANDGTVDSNVVTVTVTVTGVNDTATVSSASQTLTETDAALSTSGTLTSTDVDNTDNLFTASSTTGTYGDFSIGTDGAWTFTANSAFDSLNVGDNVNETFNVTSVDGTSSTVTVQIDGTNDAATISSASQTLTETNAALSTSGTLTSTDVDTPDNTFTADTISGTIGTFTIDAAGAWTFTANSAFDSLNVGDNVNETFNVTSVDGTSSTVTIQIDGINDAPIITPGQIYTIPEDSVNTSIVGTVIATDIDTIGTLDNWTIIAGNINGIFTINAGTGEITVGDNTNLDFELRTSYTLSIQVDDGVNTSAIENVTINVTDINDNAPVIISGQSFNLSGDANIGQSVGSVTAIDSDTVGTLQNWTIFSGNSSGIFTINGATGLITVSDNTNINPSTSAYTLGIQVEDGINTSVIENITINVSHVVETVPPPPPPVEEEPEPPPVDEPVEDITEETFGEETPADTDTPQVFIEEPINTASEEDGPLNLEEDVVEEVFYENILYVTQNDSETYIPESTDQTNARKYLEQKIDLRHNDIELTHLVDTYQLTPVNIDLFNYDRSEMDNNTIWKDLDTLRDDMDKAFVEEAQERNFGVKAVTGASASLAVGTAAYLMRAGSLLSSFMASVPLWKGFDPVSVLAFKSKKEKDNDKDLKQQGNGFKEPENENAEHLFEDRE